MRLYIDKENILAFLSDRKSDNDLFEESIRLIKKGLSVYYNFPKKDILGNDALFAWFKEMKGTGVQMDSVFCSDENEIKPVRPIRSNFYSEYNAEDRSSVYLLNIEENMRNTIRDKNSILIGYPGDEMKIFESLLSLNDQEQFMCDIRSWKDYCPQIPLTDVIICDNHYFKDERVYNKNDHELIRALAEISRDSLNVVIITKEGEIDRNINLESECQKIKNIVSQVSGLSRKRCAVTILTTYRMHSRHIITNYYRIVPTTCIHLRESGLKEDANIDIKPNSNYNSEQKCLELLNTCQMIAKIPVHIYGDKKSNYIDFN